MNFKDQVAVDVAVFLNSDEFGRRMSSMELR